MSAYYNENDPKAAAWLRELIRADLIAPGDVDERSITEVQPSDLNGYIQHHFFSGIGGWSYALRLAGWPDERPVWTGSCPCQPFSAAGKQLGTSDKRHLWPAFFSLIDNVRPAAIFGEQVASKSALPWLDGVFTDLEGADYACAAADLCAASCGAPHIRQRLYWVAYADGGNPGAERKQCSWEQRQQQTDGCVSCRLADSTSNRRERRQDSAESAGRTQPEECCATCRLEHAQSDRRQQRGTEPSGRRITSGCGPSGLGDSDESGSQGRGIDVRQHANQRTPWQASEFIMCLDGKARRVETGTFPLAHGVSGRVGLLRGYGNAIVPQVAAEFIQACEEARAELLTK